MTVSRFHVPAMDCAAEEQLIRMALDDRDDLNRIETGLARQLSFRGRRAVVVSRKEPLVASAAPGWEGERAVLAIDGEVGRMERILGVEFVAPALAHVGDLLGESSGGNRIGVGSPGYRLVMDEPGLGFVEDSLAEIANSQAEIDVVEGDSQVVGVETADQVEDVGA